MVTKYLSVLLISLLTILNSFGELKNADYFTSKSGLNYRFAFGDVEGSGTSAYALLYPFNRSVVLRVDAYSETADKFDSIDVSNYGVESTRKAYSFGKVFKFSDSYEVDLFLREEQGTYTISDYTFLDISYFDLGLDIRHFKSERLYIKYGVIFALDNDLDFDPLFSLLSGITEAQKDRIEKIIKGGLSFKTVLMYEFYNGINIEAFVSTKSLASIGMSFKF